MAATPVFEEFVLDAVGATTYTFSGADIGPAAADRIVVVVCQTEGGASLSSATIGGSSADIRVQSNNGNVVTAIITRLVTSGTTADIVVTWNTSTLRCLIGVYSLTGATEVPVDTDAAAAASGTGQTLTVTIPANGCAINGDSHGSGTTPTTWGGSSAADYDEPPTGSSLFSGSLTPSTGSLRTDHSITTSHANSTQPIAAATVVWSESAGISAVVPSEFDMDNADIDIDGGGFGATIGASDVYLSPNDLLTEAGEVDITTAVNTWSDTQINLDLTSLSQAVLDSLQSMGPGARFIIVNVGGVPATDEHFSAVTLHRPQGFQMVLGAATPGTTTSRLTGMTGTFGGGRIEETAAQNPSTTNTNVANNGNREDVWSIEAKPLSREVQYDFRVLYGGVVADTITQTPQVTIAGGTAVPVFYHRHQTFKSP